MTDDRSASDGVDIASVRAHARRLRLPLLLSALLLPWTVYLAGGDAALVFPWGLVDPSPIGVTDLYSYLFVYTNGLPDHLLAWPLSAGLYAVALGSAALGRFAGVEDVRVTALLLGLAGFAHLSVSRGLALQPGRAAYPVGTVALWALAAFVYWIGSGGDGL